MSSRDRPRMILPVLAALAVLGLWLLGVRLLPAIVRAAYEGTSIGLVNGLITGQEYHPVERYLNAAARLGRIGTVLLATGLVVLLSGLRFRDPLKRAVGLAFRQPPRAGLVEIMLSAIALGLLFGLFEAGALWIRFRGDLTTFNNPDVFWLAPLAIGALFAGLALSLFVVTLGWREGLSHRAIVVVCATIGIAGVLRGLRLGLNPLAAWLLAVGVGVQLARMTDGRPGLWRAFRRGTVPAVVLLGLAPLLYPSGRRFQVDTMVGGPPSPSAPNVLLLVLDTVRGESLGFGGYGRPTSPNLDRLAERAVVFDRAIAPSPWTLPSHASMFTGRYLHEIGVAWDRGLPETFPTLAEAMGTAGYVRGGFVANKVNAGRGTGLERGFNWFVDHPRSLGTWFTSAFVTKRLSELVWPKLSTPFKALDRKYAPEVNREFIDWLDEVDGSPFFAFLNYLDAHAPYEDRAEFSRGFAAGSRSLVFDADGRERSPSGPLARDIDAYDSGIAFIDDQIGKLLQELEGRGLLEETLIIVTSDHGEHLGERGLIDHGNSLYSQLLLVPLLLYWPGHVPEGVRVEAPASLRDLPATIADVAGLGAFPLPGESLTRFWGASNPDRQERALSELEASPHGGFAPGPNQLGDMKAIVDGSLHYILNGDGREELFDLAVDRRGRNDLAQTETGRRELPRLRARLDELLVATNADPASVAHAAAAGNR